MEERKWENLNEDCLVNVFGRLDLETLLLDIPVVCKQWHQALLNTLCWQKLVFPVDISRSRLADATEGSISGLIKFVIGRSHGCATTIALPSSIMRKDLILVSVMCPTLKVLEVPSRTFVDVGTYVGKVDTHVGNVSYTISELIVKWKSLEVLKLNSSRHIVQIIDKIGLYCENFVELSVKNVHINQEVASAIVSKLAHIKRLVLDETELEKVNLELILRGCKELELLYARDCLGFDDDDGEILVIASRIKDFRCEGSRTEIHDSYESWVYLL